MIIFLYENRRRYHTFNFRYYLYFIFHFFQFLFESSTRVSTWLYLPIQYLNIYIYIFCTYLLCILKIIHVEKLPKWCSKSSFYGDFFKKSVFLVTFFLVFIFKQISDVKLRAISIFFGIVSNNWKGISFKILRVGGW